jgi:prepilin-type N-terminal cleavage/methylation domain-containing protein
VTCAKQRVGRAAGFTLIETLVVLAIVGLLVLVAIVPIGSYWQRSRLETTAGDIRNFLQSAYSEAINQHTQVVVTLQKNATTGLWELYLTPPPLNGSRFLVLPEFVSFAYNPLATLGGWPVSSSDANVRGIMCDPSGRTMVPVFPVVPVSPVVAATFTGSSVETAGQAVQEIKTLAVTHANMVDGSLQPNTRDDIMLFPIWTATVRKVLL